MQTKSSFIGRKVELRALNDLLDKKISSLVVIRGRRRIGKSRLVREFALEKKCLVFSGVVPNKNTTAQSQRNEFMRQLSAQTDLPEMIVDDWGKIFTLLSKELPKDPIIVLFDEISWMGSKDPDFLGKLKNAWDLQWMHHSKLILILCGSVSSWIEKNILSSTAFFGRVALKLTLEELNLEDCNQLLESIGFKKSPIEKWMILSVTGGIPWYIELNNPKYSAIKNISNLCFDKNGTLVDEFNLIFNDLFGRKGEICRKIVECLTNGPSEQTDIIEKLQYARSGSLSQYLKELEISGFISRDYNWSFKNGDDAKISRIRLKDNYLRFYLKYIKPRLNRIKLGQFQDIDIATLPNWDGIMGLQFENLVLNNRALIHQLIGIDPHEIIAANPYFQKKTTKHVGCQIDYLIQTRYNNFFVCEIKFSRKLLDRSVITAMERKISALSVPKGFALQPVLIHVNGVSEEIKEANYFFKIIDLSQLL